MTDTLKARLAGYYSASDGFFRNIQRGPLPALGGVIASKRLPAQKNWMIRGTVLWNPTSQFDARLKLANARDYAAANGALQLVRCPDGVGPVNGLQFISPTEDCKQDRNINYVDASPAGFPALPISGAGFIATTQTYGTVELNYHLTPQVTLTSETAYYLLHSKSLFGTPGPGYGGASLLVRNGYRRHQATEELRLNSEFAGPLNVTAGGYIERGRASNRVIDYGNTTFPGFAALFRDGTNVLGIKSESLFGQVRYRIIPKVELAAGARWTNERRTMQETNFLTGAPVTLAVPVPSIHSRNVSPEVTLTYKPTDDTTLFAAGKRGYKSGSYNITAPPTAGLDTSFGDEKVTGGEIGLKSRMLDRTLYFNLAGYLYHYAGLQVAATIPTTGGAGPIGKTINAGAARVRGVEAEIHYRPPQVEDLGLHAAVNYNRAYYKDLKNIPCYGGQTIAAGCDLLIKPNGTFAAQDASGLPLIRAAKWQANFGFDWETPVGHGMKLVVADTNQVSTRYIVNLAQPYYQKAFLKADLSLTLQGPRDRWEVALIGKNLNNAITTGNCTTANDQGALLGGEVTGSTGRGPAGVDEMACYLDRGRELWIRVTYRPFN